MDELHFCRLRNKGVIQGEHLDTGVLISLPVEMSALCAAIAHRFLRTRVDLIIGPPGGPAAIVRYETASHLVKARRYQHPAMFQPQATLNSHEGEPWPEFQDKKVLLVTDILSATEKPTVKEMVNAIQARGAQVVGVGALGGYGPTASYDVDPEIPIFAAVDLSPKTSTVAM